MSIIKMVMMFFVWVTRIVLYPSLLVLRILGRTSLLAAVVLTVLLPALFSLILFDLLRDFDLARSLGEYYQFLEAFLLLSGAGLFSWLLKKVGESAWKALLTLLATIKWLVRGQWIPGWEIVRSLAGTWRDNFAEIPGAIRETGREALHLIALLTAGAILLLVMLPLFPEEPKLVDRQVFVVGAPEVTNCENQGKPKRCSLKENIIEHMRAGAVFSLTHLQDGQPKSGNGICLVDTQQKWLIAFREAIADCVKLEQERGVSRGAMPTFEVTAFASTAPAKVADTVDPKVNCEIANRRAHAVGAFLAGAEIADKRRWTCKGVKEDFRKARNLCDGDQPIHYPEGDSDSGFRVQVNQWADAAQMEGGKPADDGALPDQRRYRVEMFNRSVHITVPQDFCRVPES